MADITRARLLKSPCKSRLLRTLSHKPYKPWLVTLLYESVVASHDAVDCSAFFLLANALSPQHWSLVTRPTVVALEPTESDFKSELSKLCRVSCATCLEEQGEVARSSCMQKQKPPCSYGYQHHSVPCASTRHDTLKCLRRQSSKACRTFSIMMLRRCFAKYRDNFAF